MSRRKTIEDVPPTYGDIVGRVIRMQREFHGISLEAMAKTLGFKGSSGWSRAETGDTEITMNSLYRVAKALGTSPTKLLQMADDLARGLIPNPAANNAIKKRRG